MAVDETSQSMFGLGHMNPMMLLQSFREINSILSMFLSKVNTDEDTLNYNFTGQHTDIAFVAENGSLEASEIERISDDNLRNNVMKSYSDAVQDGYLNYNDSNRLFTLTDKGREHINSDAFMEQFEKDQLNALSENKAQIKLNGNSSDLNVFRYTDSINLNHLAFSNPVAFKRVQDYFYECQKYGFVDISHDGTVKPTEKCNRYLERNKSFDFDIEKMNSDNVSRVANDMKEFSKKPEGLSEKKVVEKSGKEAVSDTGIATGQEAAAQSSRFAAEQSAKKAREEAAKKAATDQVAKQAARKAASQASAKAAGSAAAGAASMGIGAAVSAVINLTTKGADKLTSVNSQGYKPTVRQYH